MDKMVHQEAYIYQLNALEIAPVINKPKKVRVTSVPKKFSFDDYMPNY
jgi:hypothetical protein